MVETSDYDKFMELESPMAVAELNLLFFLLVDEDELGGNWKQFFGWEKGWVDSGRDQASVFPFFPPSPIIVLGVVWVPQLGDPY